MKRTRVVLATTAAALTLAGTAWAAFEPEAGSPYRTDWDPLALFTADFNNDQRPDIAVMNGSASTIDFYLRQATGGFALEGAGVPVAAGPSQAVAADFNGDGLTDLAVSGFNSGNISVLIRRPDGGFTTESIPGFGVAASAIGAGDFDGDGKVDDLAVGLWTSNQVGILLRNTANDGFDVGRTFSTNGSTARNIAVADFNRDGLSDIAVTNFTSASVTILRQSANHSFAPEGAALPVGTSPGSVVAADFNRDLLPDLAVSSSGSNTVSVFLRSADAQSFEQEGAPITVGQSPQQLAVADFEGDGYPDLAVAAAGAGAVDVLRRNPTGGFTADPPIPVSGSVQAVTAGDYARDGWADLAYAALGNPGSMTVLANPAPIQPPPAPTPTVTPVPTATPIPSPVAGKTVNATPVSGKVKVKLPGKSTFTNLTGEQQLPVGTSVDARNGRITIGAAGQGGKADFYEGLFKISQSTGKKPLTTLTLTEPLSCPKGKKASAAAAKKKKSRHLWGSGKGSFRTTGTYSAATIRGTRWLVTDRCDSTTTKVADGVVSVRDKVKHKTKIVRKGHSYIARRRR